MSTESKFLRRVLREIEETLNLLDHYTERSREGHNDGNESFQTAIEKLEDLRDDVEGAAEVAEL